AAPQSLGVLRLRSGSVVVSETEVMAESLGSTFTVYVENSDVVQSGLALVNPSGRGVTAALELVTLGGAPTGFTSAVVIPARGQPVRFLNELPGFENVPATFQGIVKIRSTAAPISVIGLRKRANDPADSLITTRPINNDVPAAVEELVIPEFVVGGGYA